MSASVSQYVLKVCSRCDLACDHCYVFEHADQSWRTKPRFITTATARQAARRISEHAKAHRLEEVHVVLHGGEPLLLGYDRLHEVIRVLRSLIEPVTRLDLRIQTNGVRLDEKLCELFDAHAVQVGISLDGDRAANDRHRRFPDGRSSYSHVQQALSLLRRPKYRHLYAGILCTVDVRNDPITVYQALLAAQPPRIDLLMPHATWDQPPYRLPGGGGDYAAWLGRIHSRWLADGRPFPVKYFDSVLDAWEGRPSGSEAAGLDPVDLLVVETNGSWEQADSLKTAFENAPETGLDVFSHSVDEAVAHPGVAGRQAGLSALCPTCRECGLVRACGGGLYAHRFKSGSGFDNPSVYCDDLKVLIPRIVATPRTASIASGNGSSPGQPLPGGTLERLSGGAGDPEAMASLADSYWSVTRALVAAVASGLPGKGNELRRAAAEGWELLSELDATRPEIVRDVLSYPYVEAWAIQCLEADSADRDLDLAHMAGLAAAVAIRAGLELDLVLPVREGAIHLPGLGALAVGNDTGRTSVVHVSPAGASTRHEPSEWRPVRRVAEGLPITVEDLDPFRDCQAWMSTGRLSRTTWQEWELSLVAAALQLEAEIPGYARVISEGLRSVVPMRPAAAGSYQSATPPHAFGALALALPGNVDTLSELLVHEMQHVKLAGLCVLFDLFDRTDRALFRVPWRPDPRPVEGFLHGTYAHLALAELWRSRSRRTADPAARRLSRKYQSWVAEAIDVLLGAPALLPPGQRFVNGMLATVEAWGTDG
jgi:uncharacterized protein